MFLFVFGGLLLLLIVLWVLWSALDKAVPPQLFYNQSTFTRSVLDCCPVLQSPCVFLKHYAYYRVIYEIGYC